MMTIEDTSQYSNLNFVCIHAVLMTSTSSSSLRCPQLLFLVRGKNGGLACHRAHNGLRWQFWARNCFLGDRRSVGRRVFEAEQSGKVSVTSTTMTMIGESVTDGCLCYSLFDLLDRTSRR
ncbi:unnamed protein product [Amoebophrya sp. A120]|nr:unnamed protein product [Amoebophrya sp. A120]|eukprot:GSA120T00011535001.1